MSDLQKFLSEHKSELVALGKQHGCTFSEDDVAALADGQLTEDELGSVHGGVATLSPDALGKLSLSSSVKL